MSEGLLLVLRRHVFPYGLSWQCVSSLFHFMRIGGREPTTVWCLVRHLRVLGRFVLRANWSVIGSTERMHSLRIQKQRGLKHSFVDRSPYCDFLMYFDHG